MALVLTPVPGNGVRVEATCCNSRTIVRGFPLTTVRRVVERAEADHVCVR